VQKSDITPQFHTLQKEFEPQEESSQSLPAMLPHLVGRGVRYLLCAVEAAVHVLRAGSTVRKISNCVSPGFDTTDIHQCWFKRFTSRALKSRSYLIANQGDEMISKFDRTTVLEEQWGLLIQNELCR